jgi:hypothetical protein
MFERLKLMKGNGIHWNCRKLQNCTRLALRLLPHLILRSPDSGNILQECSYISLWLLIFFLEDRGSRDRFHKNVGKYTPYSKSS